MKERIVFISPPLTFEERYGSLGKGGANMPPIGLLYLSAVCKNAGYETFLIDASCPERPLDFVIREIFSLKPSFIGISAATVAIASANRLAKMIKEVAPHVRIILGGPHISAAPEMTMKRYDSFDIGVLGEGEETLIDLLNAFSNNVSLSKVAGIIFRNGRQLIKTESRGFIQNLDTLPFPAWELLLPFELYKLSATRFQDHPTAGLITSRGCFGKCTFCDVSVFGRRIRGHSAEYVLNMIGQLVENHNIKSLIFNDDTFAYDKKRLRSICSGLKERFSSIPWSCSSRVDMMTQESLEMMRDAGCFQIAYGVESGVPEILQQVNKNISMEQVRRTVAWTEAAGIRSKGYFIIGFPNETQDTIQRTIDFALSLPLSDFQITFLTPFPGSEVYELAKDAGEFDDDWEHMNMWDIVFVPHTLTKSYLIKKRNEAFRKFYFRPSIIAKYAKLLLEKPKFIPLLFNDFISFVKMLRTKSAH
ncbi:MAG: hypothetical protein A3J72_06210 [Nitrospirae bacterium RIFCSPHIGHO2_02_FULL_40_19]|nr:MAG: hypothetical protein A3J72_06210 [Nitrospirae bacterium RIFCSPHIGHO2_02_FULL_40_19]